jgi:hypothetical protein
VPDNATGDHYVPPPPPPIHINDPVNAVLLGGVIGAPLVYVIVGMLIDWEPFGIGALCVVVFVVCFIALVVRAKPRARPRDGWDNGAVL